MIKGLGGREFAGLSAQIRDFLKNKEDTSAKAETWTRLTEMAGSPVGCFGFCETRLRMGAYNPERKATTLRQFATDKDASWGGGLRVPIGNRIAHAAASLTWGAINTDKPGEDVLTLADCTPFTYDAYDAFTTDGKKYETRGETPQTIDAFTRAAKKQVELSPYFLGRNTLRNGWKWSPPPNNSMKPIRKSPATFSDFCVGIHDLPLCVGCYGWDAAFSPHVSRQCAQNGVQT